MKKKLFISILFFILLVIAGLFYFRYEVYYSHGSYKDTKIFVIEKGRGNAQVSADLKDQGLVSGKIYFYYYVRSHGLLNKIMPGEYQLSGNMSIPEIAQVITNPELSFIKITFPEGWTSKQMAARLAENGLNGDGFLKIVNNPGDFKRRYSYLNDPKVTTLEGFLFPDTFYFKKDVTAENIVGRMLDTFDSKITDKMKADMAGQSKSIYDVLTMASVIEEEVKSSSDRQVVSGIFWNRIGAGMPLQSDATLTYILGDGKDSHSIIETKTDSPYNTYANKGLPPTPIDNPSLDSISAALYPKQTNYMYFISSPKCGTLFATTLDGHNQNKAKCGL